MKFAVFVFIAGLCLATANVVPIEDLSDDYVAVETQGIFSGIYGVTKGALRTLKGINCAIQAAVKMQQAAVQFNTDVQNCGGIVPTQIQAIITSSNNVITDVNNLINVNDTICNNADSENTSTKTGWNCFWKILKQFLTLKNDIQKTIKAINALPTSFPDTQDCFYTAADTLLSTLNSFPSYMSTCSKLTSN